MKNYIFYRKGDKNKEPLGTDKSSSLYIASIKFAEKKQIGLIEFNKLFEVEERKGK